VIPVISEYCRKYTEVTIKVLLSDHVLNLIEEQVDIAIRIGHLKDSGLYATNVGFVKRLVCGANKYFQDNGVPKKPEELEGHSIIFPTTFESTTVWQFSYKGRKKSIKIKPTIQVNQNAAALRAALSGAGITRLMSYQIAEYINDGSLVRVLESYEDMPMPVSVLHAEMRRANAKVKTFLDMIVTELRANPYINEIK
jgi:DNA-binding transcriptional LysR family regulator